MGKFYYRPPGGESWTDVILRARACCARCGSGMRAGGFGLVSHQAVIMAFRYLLQSLTEQDVLGEDARTALGDCSVIDYRPTAGGALALITYGRVDHLTASGAEPTHEEPRSGRTSTQQVCAREPRTRT